MSWTTKVPTIDDFPGSYAYYWYRGSIFNRPIVVCLHKGAGIGKGPSGESPPWRELHSDFDGTMDTTYRPYWPKGEWAGPIPEPSVKKEQE